MSYDAELRRGDDRPAARTSATALWIGRVMTGLFVLFMLFDVGIKLLRLPIVDDAMIQLGYPPGLGFAIGVLEGALLDPLPDSRAPPSSAWCCSPACSAAR